MTDERPILEGSGAESSLPPQRRPTSTERVRHCRRRKRDGLKLAHVELRQYEIAYFRRRGWLQTEGELDPWVLGDAVCSWLDEAMAGIVPN